MDKNSALTLLKILRRQANGKPLTDTELRRLTGFDQIQLDLAAEQLESESMLIVERTYTLVED